MTGGAISSHGAASGMAGMEAVSGSLTEAHRILVSPESPHLREADEALRMLGVSLAGN